MLIIVHYIRGLVPDSLVPSRLLILGPILILGCFLLLYCDIVVICVHAIFWTGEITRLSCRDKAEINPFGCHGFIERSDCHSLWCWGSRMESMQLAASKVSIDRNTEDRRQSNHRDPPWALEFPFDTQAGQRNRWCRDHSFTFRKKCMSDLHSRGLVDPQEQEPLPNTYCSFQAARRCSFHL